MNGLWKVALALLGLAGTGSLCGCSAVVEAENNGASTEGQLVRVEVISAVPNTLSRTTTQPATVHAYYRARLFAKATGYLTELSADIGKTVKKGDELGVIDVPELGRQREMQLATVKQMEAEERRAASGISVAQAAVASYGAKREKAQAEVGKADADVVAAQVEMERVTDLVNQRAVADRVLDEIRKKHDAAAAQKVAANAAVDSAAAELTLATAQVESARADVDVAKAMTEVARRRLDELDELIRYTSLAAPFDGVITQRNIEPGDLVRSMQSGDGSAEPLFIIVQLDRVRVRVPIPERDAPYADVGDEAAFTFQALPGRVFEGSVSRISGELAEQTRTMLVEIDLPNAKGELRPGMFGQAVVQLAPPGKTSTLPAQAVHYDETGASFVYVVSASDEVVVTKVTTGLDDGRQIEITSGLAGEERIVGPLLHRLRPGQKVDVQE